MVKFQHFRQKSGCLCYFPKALQRGEKCPAMKLFTLTGWELPRGDNQGGGGRGSGPHGLVWPGNQGSGSHLNFDFVISAIGELWVCAPQPPPPMQRHTRRCLVCKIQHKGCRLAFSLNLRTKETEEMAPPKKSGPCPQHLQGGDVAADQDGRCLLLRLDQARLQPFHWMQGWRWGMPRGLHACNHLKPKIQAHTASQELPQNRIFFGIQVKCINGGDDKIERREMGRDNRSGNDSY